MSQKGSVSTTVGIVIIIVIAIALGGYIYWNGQNDLAPSPFPSVSIPHSLTQKNAVSPPFLPPAVQTPTPPSSDQVTANWKTYRDEKYGFEVRYPLLLTKLTKENQGNGITLGYCEEKNGYGRCIKNGEFIRISVIDKPFDLQKVDQYYDARILALPFEVVTINKKDFHIGANAAFGLEEWLVHTSLGEKTLQISLSGDIWIGTPEKNGKGIEHMKVILSTFTFTR